jgi:hypothetical protein
MRESLSPAPLGKGCGGELGLCWSMNSTLLIPTIGTSEPIFGTATQGQLPICMSRIALFGSESRWWHNTCNLYCKTVRAGPTSMKQWEIHCISERQQ